jgi:hypothetical protein
MYASHDPSCCPQGKSNISTSLYTAQFHVQLLEAIGALTRDERNKAKSRAGVYQEASTESVDREQDGQTGDGEDGQDTEDVSPTSTIGSAVFKASFLPHSWLP